MSKAAAIKKLNDTELELGIAGSGASWHQKYLQCDTIYIGGLADTFTEQDLLAVLEQYGTVLHVHLVRDSNTNASRGFAFVKYADPRSCVLAVDNLSGFEIDGRSLRLDHADDYQDKDNSGVDTTPSDFHASDEKESNDYEGLERVRPTAVEANADKCRENAVLARLEQMRKGRKLNGGTHLDKDLNGKSTSMSRDEQSVQDRNVKTEAHHGEIEEKKRKREENERRRNERERRKDERARIRKERAERRAARQGET